MIILLLLLLLLMLLLLMLLLLTSHCIQRPCAPCCTEDCMRT
jgi:hypothetical protein